MTRYFAETHPEPFLRGTSEFMAFYGAPLGGMETQYVNGYAYNTMRPAPDEEIPQRFARAEEVWERKVWREQLQEWDEQAKPASIARHRELQAVDPDALSDEDLATYLERCRDHHREMMYQHMRFTASAMMPVGDLLAHVRAWTTVTSADALAMMRGSAPVSAGASDELARLIAALDADATARSLLESDGDPEKVLAELRGAGGEVGAAVSGYLDLVGYRLLDGFDISGRYCPRAPRRAGARDPIVRRRYGRRLGGGRSPDRTHSRPGPRRAPRRVRRAARRGAPHVPPARRARRVQRHLGVGHHAPRGRSAPVVGSPIGAACTIPST